MAREYPTDEKIKETFLKTSDKYEGKSDEWLLRITADDLNCPISYVRNVLAELDNKGEL